MPLHGQPDGPANSTPDEPPRLDDPDDLQPPPAIEPPHVFGEFLPKTPPERLLVRRVAFLVGGTVLILIGMVIWVTPVVGGAPLFLIPGLLLLAKASDPLRRLINHGDRRLPAWARRAMRWARDKVHRTPAAPVGSAADPQAGKPDMVARSDQTPPPA